MLIGSYLTLYAVLDTPADESSEEFGRAANRYVIWRDVTSHKAVEYEYQERAKHQT
jgi:hypothetical protein